MRTNTFYFLIMSFYLLFSVNISAQNFWENTYSGMLGQAAYETSDGGYIVSSTESSIMNVYKLDLLGNVEWKKRLSGFYEGSVVKPTLNGGYIAVGRAQSSNRYIAIAKLDALGNLEWGKTQDLNNVFEAKDVIQLSDSSFIVCSAGGDNSGFDYSALTKYDKNGILIWSKTFRTCSQSGCHPLLNFLLDNQNGEFFAFGQYDHNSSYRTGWILKFDANGTIIEQKASSNLIRGATKTSDGNIVVAGGVGLAPTNAILMKFNPQTMTPMWSKSYSLTMPFSAQASSYGMSVYEDSNSDLYLYSTTDNNWTRCVVIKTNSFGTVINYSGMANYTAGALYAFDTRMSRTSDSGFIIVYGNRIKKIPENFSSTNTCGLFHSLSVSTSNLSVGMTNESPTIYTTNSVIGSVTSSTQPIPSVVQICSTYYCSPVSGTDIQSACSSYTWIDNNTYTTSNNTATHTIPNGAANGCDSIVTLSLTINNATNGTDVITACDSYTWIDNNTYTTSNNTATHTITNGAANGCDSIITLNLTINNTATGTDIVTACNSYTWIDNNTYTTSNNTATHTITNGAANGCDSIVTLNLTINNTATGTDVITACNSYTWIDNNTYTTSNNTATHAIPNSAANGCDSIVTLNLTINNATNGTDVITACDSYTWIDNNAYSTSNNTATHTIPNGAANGCDSIVTLSLTINNATNGTDVITACNSYTWIDNNTYTTSNNTATHTIVNGAANGCDSVVTLNLTINTVDNTTSTQGNDSIIANATGASYQWLDCNNNYAIIPNATNQLFVASANGSYAVEVTQNSCTDTSNCVTISGVGIDELATLNLLIYPNPTTGKVTVELERLLPNITFQVKNVVGQTIETKTYFSTNKIEFNLQGDKGIYFLIIENEHTNRVYKILKQ